jgi:hypothetical protein
MKLPTTITKMKYSAAASPTVRMPSYITLFLQGEAAAAAVRARLLEVCMPIIYQMPRTSRQPRGQLFRAPLLAAHQFSPVMIWNTVSSALAKLSKVEGDTVLRPTAARYSQRPRPAVELSPAPGGPDTTLRGEAGHHTGVCSGAAGTVPRRTVRSAAAAVARCGT